jgi:Zn-dependent protease
MENFQASSYEQGNNEEAVTSESGFTYPPKYEKQEQPANVWLKSLISLALYLILGYYIFHSFQYLLLITAIVIFHELGHFFAMKFFRYKDLGIFFIPLLGAYVSGTKREVSQKESAIILLAGPLPGIIAGIIFHLLYQQDPSLHIAGISFTDISIMLIFLNILNLLPIYPLDGGQLLNRVFLDEEGWISRIFIFLSVGFMCWFILFGMNRPFYPLLIFPALILLRFFGDAKMDHVEKKIESEGIDLNKSYEELPDADYWKIRNILIAEHKDYKDIEPAPPYGYSVKEEKIMVAVKSLLHRHLIEDLPAAGKIFIFIICLAAIASPWLLQIDILERFRF